MTYARFWMWWSVFFSAFALVAVVLCVRGAEFGFAALNASYIVVHFFVGRYWWREARSGEAP